MRRIWPILFLSLAGCSNAPIAGFLDNCFPNRAKVNNPDPKPPIDIVPPDPLRPGPGPTPTPTPTPTTDPNPSPIPPPVGVEPQP